MNGHWRAIDFNPETASPELWRQFHAFRRARHAERGDPDDPFLPDDTFETSWLQEWQEADWAQYEQVFLVGDRIVADLAAVEDLRVLDFNGHQIMTHFALSELGEPIKFES